MTISNEAVESAAWAMRDLYAQEVCELPVESFFKEARAALEAVAPIIRAECLEEAADAALDREYGLDGSLIRASEGRGFMQRHNVSAAARWLRARAVSERGRQ